MFVVFLLVFSCAYSHAAILVTFSVLQSTCFLRSTIAGTKWDFLWLTLFDFICRTIAQYFHSFFSPEFLLPPFTAKHINIYECHFWQTFQLFVSFQQFFSSTFLLLLYLFLLIFLQNDPKRGSFLDDFDCMTKLWSDT